MKFEIQKSFAKDASKLQVNLKLQLSKVVEEIEAAKTLSQINNCKKMKGHKDAYRIKLGQYRIGFYFENNVIELSRILARKDIYKFFP